MLSFLKKEKGKIKIKKKSIWIFSNELTKRIGKPK